MVTEPEIVEMTQFKIICQQIQSLLLAPKMD